MKPSWIQLDEWMKVGYHFWKINLLRSNISLLSLSLSLSLSLFTQLQKIWTSAQCQAEQYFQGDIFIIAPVFNMIQSGNILWTITIKIGKYFFLQLYNPNNLIILTWIFLQRYASFSARAAYKNCCNKWNACFICAQHIHFQNIKYMFFCRELLTWWKQTLS